MRAFQAKGTEEANARRRERAPQDRGRESKAGPAGRWGSRDMCVTRTEVSQSRTTKGFVHQGVGAEMWSTCGWKLLEGFKWGGGDSVVTRSNLHFGECKPIWLLG